MKPILLVLMFALAAPAGASDCVEEEARLERHERELERRWEESMVPFLGNILKKGLEWHKRELERQQERGESMFPWYIREKGKGIKGIGDLLYQLVCYRISLANMAARAYSICASDPTMSDVRRKYYQEDAERAIKSCRVAQSSLAAYPDGENWKGEEVLHEICFIGTAKCIR